MTRHPDPLNAEERELAARLARLGGAREPAPGLDARILAAARAAVSAPATPTTVTTPAAATDTPATTLPAAPPAPETTTDTPANGGGNVVPMRSRRQAARWPLGFGLAASVVLAAGIGWRMHGNGAGDEQAMSDAEMKTVVAPPPPEDAVTEMVELEPPVQHPPPPEPPPLEPDRPKAPPPPPERVLRDEGSVGSAAPTTYEFTMDESVHHDTAAEAVAAAPPPAPPAPAAPPLPAAKAGASELRRAESDGSLDAIQVTGSRVRAATAQDTAAQPALTVERSRAGRQNAAGAPPPAATAPVREADGFDDQPPASADSPEVRQAWLQRIRTLLTAGRHDAAVESLQEFRRRYPDVELPDDLRRLAATLPAPAP